MRLAIARIGRPHGIKGEVTIEALTDRPEERFVAGHTLECDSPLHQELEIARVRVHQGIWMLTFNQIVDRNEAERLRNSRLYAEVDLDQSVDEDESYHVEQLKGMKVQGVDGREIGFVIDVENLPGQDLLKVETVKGERLIPMVQQFIEEIDLVGGRIVVRLPDGLVD
jgi:16S rRNA processing protein RimM